MTQKKRLKRGLEHLISQSALTTDDAAVPAVPTHSSGSELIHLPLLSIQPGKYQPRKEMDLSALEDLASSIRAQGILQPVIVRRISDEQYELIAGERRWRAAKIAGLEEVPAIVKEVDDRRTMAMALIENIQRENLNPIEEAEALHALISDHKLTHQQLAEAIGKSRATVSNLLRLMSLCPDVKQMVSHGDISTGHAKVLLSLNPEEQYKAALQVVEKQLSVRETEQLVELLQQDKKVSPKSRTRKDPDVIALERRLTDMLRVAVKVQHNTSGKGKLVIHYDNLKELDDILHHIE